METNNKDRISAYLAPRYSRLVTRQAFTLVELLVVIVIIGILAALITVAAVAALRTARKAQIKAEITEISNGFDEYKNKTTAYPPNCQTDGTGAANPIDETTVLTDLKRHMKQAFPRHQESDNLLRALAGLSATGSDASDYPRALGGGLTAGEALVFWLGGFSSDPKYPISGEGGPSYNLTGVSAGDKSKVDPIESRKWIYPFDINRLGPRASTGYFDETNGSGRYIEYTATINGARKLRRINFWQYTPSKSGQPYLYFDTSRHPAYDTSVAAVSRFDPPAATADSKLALDVFALKKINPSYLASSTTSPPVTFINPEKFQVIHCGLDDAWGTEGFGLMSARTIGAAPYNRDAKLPASYLLFPSGPFVGDIADTQVNFATETTIEDSQK